MKQLRLGPGELHPWFVDFAAHYSFAIKTHRVRRPRTKGKVERMVHYVKDAFLNGRSFGDLASKKAYRASMRGSLEVVTKSLLLTAAIKLRLLFAAL